jgi:hypothetical protein
VGRHVSRVRRSGEMFGWGGGVREAVTRARKSVVRSPVGEGRGASDGSVCDGSLEGDDDGVSSSRAGTSS